MGVAYSATVWGGFGTTVATAAATLTGLLFIAVSINLKRILDYKPLPGRAAQTLFFFVLPLIFSLLLVVAFEATNGFSSTQAELFPTISVGDAPP